MTRAEVVAVLNECEERFEMFENAWVRDVNIWPLIKTKIGEQLVHNDMKPTNPSPAGNKSLKALKGFTGKSSIRRQLRDAGDVLFISTAGHWTRLNNTLTERYAHPFLPHFDELGISSSLAHVVGRPKGSSFADQQEIDLENAIYASSLIWWRTKKQDELPAKVLECLEWIRERNPHIDPSYMRQMVFTLFFYRDFFRHALEGTDMKSVFMVCFYAVHNLALSLVGKEMGFSTVDIQHGVQGKNNIAYGHWNLPDKGSETLPDYFWCWDENDAELINSWPGNSNHFAVAGGDLWGRAWNDLNDPVSLNSTLPETSDDKKLVLFSLQNIAEPIPEVVVRTILYSDNFTWWFRCHPMHYRSPEEFRQELTNLGIADKVHFTSATELPLPLVLAKVDVHITNWSSVVLDAKRAGVHSVVVHENGKDVFADMLSQGKVSYFSGASGTLEETLMLAAKRKTSSSAEVSDPEIALKKILLTTQ